HAFPFHTIPRDFLCLSATGMKRRNAFASMRSVLKLFSMRDKCGDVGRIKRFDLVEGYFLHYPSGQSSTIRFCIHVKLKLFVIVLTLSPSPSSEPRHGKREGNQLVSLTVRQIADYTLPLLVRGLGRGL